MSQNVCFICAHSSLIADKGREIYGATLDCLGYFIKIALMPLEESALIIPSNVGVDMSVCGAAVVKITIISSLIPLRT
jgi:hypothetical protein